MLRVRSVLPLEILLSSIDIGVDRVGMPVKVGIRTPPPSYILGYLSQHSVV